MEMVRMAKIYHNEGNRENAYILYLKFMTLFLEKIQLHPEYKTYPGPAKRATQERLRDVLIVAEKLRVRLLATYDAEHQQQLVQMQQQQQQQLADAEAERQRRHTALADYNGEASSPKPMAPSAPPPLILDAPHNFDEFLSAPQTVPRNPSLDQVVYPGDFPPAANRAHQPAGLLLPDPANAMPK